MTVHSESVRRLWDRLLGSVRRAPAKAPTSVRVRLVGGPESSGFDGAQGRLALRRGKPDVSVHVGRMGGRVIVSDDPIRDRLPVGTTELGVRLAEQYLRDDEPGEDGVWVYRWAETPGRAHRRSDALMREPGWMAAELAHAEEVSWTTRDYAPLALDEPEEAWDEDDPPGPADDIRPPG